LKNSPKAMTFMITSMVKMAVTALSRLCTALPREELGSRLKVSKLSRTHEQMTTPMIKASNQRWEVTLAQKMRKGLEGRRQNSEFPRNTSRTLRSSRPRACPKLPRRSAFRSDSVRRPTEGRDRSGCVSASLAFRDMASLE